MAWSTTVAAMDESQLLLLAQMNPELRTCDVCNLVFGDGTAKLVKYCGLCDAWMCDRCRGDWMARTMAATKRAFTR